MRKLLFGFLLMVFGICLTTKANAQVGVYVGIMPPAPTCEYGYYPFYPYSCAPWGYYGPEWFSGGMFIGTGPWFHWRPYYENNEGWYRGWYGDHRVYGRVPGWDNRVHDGYIPHGYSMGNRSGGRYNGGGRRSYGGGRRR